MTDRELFLQDIKERLQTLVNELEDWIILDSELDLVLELATQLHDEVDTLLDE